MTAIDVGRICIKTRGRDTGKYCVITDIIDDNFVEITGPKSVSGIKRKKCNINHLEPTVEQIKIKKKAKDPEVEEELKKSKLAGKIKKGFKL